MANFKKIGILSSGGDAPGMNAAIRAATRRALSQGIEVVGILGGYSGLLNAADEPDMDVVRQRYLRPFNSGSVSNIVTRGGTILYSSRCPEFATPEGMNKALRACERFNIDAVIAIGGDGTFRGATDLTNHGIPSIGIPATIEAHTEVSAETACEMAAGARARLRADIGLSTTGYAGPTGGTEENPVGTVFIGIATKEGVTAHRLYFPRKSREYVREAAASRVMMEAVRAVMGVC